MRQNKTRSGKTRQPQSHHNHKAKQKCLHPEKRSIDRSTLLSLELQWVRESITLRRRERHKVRVRVRVKVTIRVKVDVTIRVKTKIRLGLGLG
jgi:hypothetical protein